MTPSRIHAYRLATSPLYQRREAAYARTHAEAKLRAAYYTEPTDTAWPALFAHVYPEHSHDDLATYL